jgi:MraZ protein
MAEIENNDGILYHSIFHHGVDEKRRVQIPSPWRPENAETELTLILWPNAPQPGSHILVLSKSEMRALGEKMKPLSLSDRRAAALRRYLGANSARVTVDKAGRVLLPESLAKPAEIDINGEAVLVGLVDKGFEIWSPKLYEEVTKADEVHQEEALKFL